MTAESGPQRKHWKEPGVDNYNAENHGTARAEEQKLVPTVLIEVGPQRSGRATAKEKYIEEGRKWRTQKQNWARA